MEKLKEYPENYHEGISYTEYVCPKCGAAVMVSDYDVFWIECEDKFLFLRSVIFSSMKESSEEV